jgi:hypothetical protein
MTEKTRKKIVFAALFIAVIWGLYNFQWPQRQKIDPVSPAAAPAGARMTQPNTLTPELVQEKTNGNWGSDPFRIPNGKSVNRQGGNWIVTGILYNTTAPLAYINRTPMRIGDTIDNARLMDIERNYVILKYNGSAHKIYFSEG